MNKLVTFIMEIERKNKTSEQRVFISRSIIRPVWFRLNLSRNRIMATPLEVQTFSWFRQLVQFSQFYKLRKKVQNIFLINTDLWK